MAKYLRLACEQIATGSKMGHPYDVGEFEWF